MIFMIADRYLEVNMYIPNLGGRRKLWGKCEMLEFWNESLTLKDIYILFVLLANYSSSSSSSDISMSLLKSCASSMTSSASTSSSEISSGYGSKIQSTEKSAFHP